MPVVNELPQKHESLTLLWENPRPNTALNSGYQTALSDPTAFDKIRVIWQFGTSSDGNEIQVDYMPINNGSISGEVWTWSISEVLRADTAVFARRITVPNNLQFWIDNCTRVGSSGNYNSYVMPLRIYGVK